jgi:glucose-1-phosphate thymidylyltransferase
MMEKQPLKIAIPMAGLGTRLRPQTWSKPKSLLHLAGKTVLDHVLDQFSTLPDLDNVEYVFIVGANQLEQVRTFMEQTHPDKKASYPVQEIMRGQSDALWQAREYLSGPMLMVFADTLVDADFSNLATIGDQAAAWVKEVPDPRRYGVTIVDADQRVQKLVEKPSSMENRLAVVGFYYFPSAEDLLSAIEEQMEQNITLKNEFFLADAINIMLARGLDMRAIQVNVWLDAGTPGSLLETNQYLLDHGHDNSAEAAKRPGVAVVPPVFIHPNAVVTDSVIGPYVSLGCECAIEQVIVKNSILDEGTRVKTMILEDSLLGRDVQVQGQPSRLNLGDNAWAME